jgi:ABC-2 type transport system permease protein
MVRWEILSLRRILPLMVIIQLFIGAGMVIGLGFLFQEISRSQALYLATGGSVVALLMVGLVMSPQLVASRKSEKTYDYMLSLPVPRAVLALSGITVWAFMALPAMSLALAAAAWWYNLELRIGPEIIPAALLTVLAGASLGAALGHVVSHPSLITLMTQVLSFFILLYSPINFPAERLPSWLQTLHGVLPFEHAAIVMRGALTEGLVGPTGGSFLVLALWTAGSWALTLWVLSRRR